MKTIKIIFVITVMVLLSKSVLSQNRSDKILFLNFNFIHGTPQLVDMTVVKGKLKKPKAILVEKLGLLFEVLSKNNNILYKNAINDPTEGMYEYPGDNGRMRKTKLKKDSITITLRIPYNTSIDKIVLYKMSRNRSLSKSFNAAVKNKYEFTIHHSLIKTGK